MSCVVCLYVRLEHMNITNTYTDKHACRDLRAAAWVILSLDVGTEHFGKGWGEGGLCKVWVYVFILFTLCSLNRDNKITEFCWCLCTDTWQTNKATHTCTCAGDMGLLLPPAGEYATDGLASPQTTSYTIQTWTYFCLLVHLMFKVK